MSALPQLIYYTICKYLHAFDAFNFAITCKDIHAKLKPLLNAHQMIYSDQLSNDAVFPIQYTKQYLEPYRYALYFLKLNAKSNEFDFSNNFDNNLFIKIYNELPRNEAFIEKVMNKISKSDNVELFAWFYKKHYKLFEHILFEREYEGVYYTGEFNKISLPNLKYLHRTRGLRHLQPDRFMRAECAMFIISITIEEDWSEFYIVRYMGNIEFMTYISYLLNGGLLKYKHISLYDSYMDCDKMHGLNFALQNFKHKYIKKNAPWLICYAEDLNGFRTLVEHYNVKLDTTLLEIFISKDNVDIVKYMLKKGVPEFKYKFRDVCLKFKSVDMFKLFKKQASLSNCMYSAEILDAYFACNKVKFNRSIFGTLEHRCSDEMFEYLFSKLQTRKKLRQKIIKYIQEGDVKQNFERLWPYMSKKQKQKSFDMLINNKVVPYYNYNDVEFLAKKIKKSTLVQIFPTSDYKEYLYKYVRELIDVQIDKNDFDLTVCKLHDQKCKYKK